MSLPEAIKQLADQIDKTIEALPDNPAMWKTVAALWAMTLRLMARAAEPPAIVLNPSDCTIPADEIERIKAEFRKQCSGGVVIGKEIAESLNHPFMASLSPTMGEGLVLAEEAPHGALRRAQEDLKRLQTPARESSPRMALVLDGPANPDGATTYVEIHPEMPEGARTEVAGAVYRLDKEGALHHVPPKEG